MSAWFQKKELSLAFGLNLSVGRFATSINGPIETIVANKSSVGNALLIGFFICCFSFVMALLLVWIDRWAAKVDNVQHQLSEEDKFQFKDLRHFRSVPFWLCSVSLTLTYMAILTYLLNCADMLQIRFGFNRNTAGFYYSIPTFISAFLCPVMGFVIDKVGKRVLFCKSALSANSR